MSRIISMAKLHLRDRNSWIWLPLIITGISFLSNLLISLSMGDALYTGGIASYYIYMLVVGLMSISQSFPFAIGFSIRRTDYFWGTIVTAAMVSAAAAFLLMLLGFIESELFIGWGADLHFFHLPFVSDGSAIERLWFHFAGISHFFVLGLVISTWHRRFGKGGTFLMFLILSILISVLVVYISSIGYWDNIGNWLKDLTSVYLATCLFAVSILYSGLSYLLLRRATV